MSLNFTVFDFEQSYQSSHASNSVISFTDIRLHYASRCILARILSKGLTEVNHEAHTHEGDNELSGARPLQRRSREENGLMAMRNAGLAQGVKEICCSCGVCLW